jgi:hypothetical protein
MENGKWEMGDGRCQAQEPGQWRPQRRWPAGAEAQYIARTIRD